MATRKPPAKKKIKSTNGCFIITILLTVLVAISLAATFYFLFLRPTPAVTPTAAKSVSAPPPAAIKPAASAAGPTKTASPAAAETPTPTPPSPTQASPVDAPPAKSTPAETTASPEPAVDAAPEPPPPASQTGPRLAIIIDDIGDTKKIAEQIIALDLPLAFSILPHTPHANHLASQAKARGRDLLVHLPMEASDSKWTHGPGTLLLSMSKEELVSTINQDLDTPYRAIGINNHMGSKFSEDPVAMRVLLHSIKARGLFFIDSLTSLNSVGYTLARDLGVKTAKRDIFLDNEQDQTKIMTQIGKLIGLAQRHGSAIGIGHPYPATLEALRASQERLSREVTMVPVHELTE